VTVTAKNFLPFRGGVDDPDHGHPEHGEQNALHVDADLDSADVDFARWTKEAARQVGH